MAVVIHANDIRFKLKEFLMKEWVQMAIALIGACILAWNQLQTLEYKVNKLETVVEKSEHRYDEIRDMFLDLKVSNARLESRISQQK
jgi:hypothetical protein